eukprot:NODE_192_length_1941_cov_82.560639_g168_i0.p1 GENE.NODE_192_length_1941_cov_82.560639_g168_i0~~NODE_192_length_1941_cov_82.560639_g168_i0.p1  ORF type:complete len:508 (+),score=48.48 NODE_192_length_1941_cov_82.560639_g168_i0:403-1926(+)
MDLKVLDQTDIVYLVFLGIYYLLLVGGVALFLLRRNVQPIKSRHRTLVLYQMILVAPHYCAITMRHILYPAFDCQVLYFTTMVFFPVWGFPYLWRCFFLWYFYYLNARIIYGARQQVAISRWMLRLRHIIGRWYYHLAVALFSAGLFVSISMVFYFLEVFGTETYGAPSCLGSLNYVIIVEVSLSVLLLMYCTYKIWDVQDSFLIKFELKLIAITGLPLLVLWVIAQMTNILPFESGDVILGILQLFQILTLWIPIFASFRKLPNDSELVVTESEVEAAVEDQSLRAEELREMEFFRLCLEDEHYGRAFEEFAIESFCVEALYFYHHARRFARMKDVSSMKTEAFVIIEAYIKPNSVFEINIEAKDRNEILRKYAKDQISADLFTVVEEHIYYTLRTDVFPLWRITSEFPKLLVKYKGRNAIIQRILKKGRPSGVNHLPLGDPEMQALHEMEVMNSFSDTIRSQKRSEKFSQSRSNSATDTIRRSLSLFGSQSGSSTTGLATHKHGY